MPGAGGLPEVVQPVSADASRYIAEYRQALAVTRELDAANRDLARSVAQAQEMLGRAGAAAGTGGADSIRAVNAAIREQLSALGQAQAAAREYASAASEVARATANAGAASAVTVEQIRAHASTVEELTKAYSRLSVAQFEALDEARMSWDEVHAAMRAAPAVYGDVQDSVDSVTASLGEQARAADSGSGSVLSYVANLGLMRDTARETAGALAESAVAASAAGAAAAGSLRDIGRSLDQTATAAGFASYRDLMKASYGGLAGNAAAYYAGAAGGGGGGGGIGPFLGGAAGGAAGGILGGGGGDFGYGAAAAAADAVSGFTRRFYSAAHWAVMLTNEVLATVGPAAAAAGVGGLAGLEGGQTLFGRLRAVNAVGQSLGPALGQTPGQFLGLGAGLQHAQTLTDPGVWQLAGAAINAVKAATGSAKGGLDDFWQSGENVVGMLDQLAAKATLAFKGGAGGEFSQLVQQGTGYLKQFGDVGANIGETFLHLVPALPGVGGDLLSTVQDATRGLADLTGILPTGVLGSALAGEAGLRWGPAIVGLAGKGLQGLGNLAEMIPGGTGVASTLGIAARKATAADVTAGLAGSEGDIIAGSGLAGMLGGAGALPIAAAAAAAYLAGNGILGYKTPEQQTIAQMQAAVGNAGTGGPQAMLDMLTSLNQTAASGAPDAIRQTLSAFGELGSGLRHGDLFEAVNAMGHILTHTGPPTAAQAAQAAVPAAVSEFAQMLQAGGQISKALGVPISQAYTLAAQSQINWTTALSGGFGGKNWQTAIQQMANTQAGYLAMNANRGQYGMNTAAVQAAQGVAGTQLSTVNSSWDTLVASAAGGTAGMPAFLAGIQAIGGGKNLAAFARSLASFGGGSASAWAAFSSTSSTSPGLLQQASSMMDWARTAQTYGALSAGQGQTLAAYMEQKLLPLAGKSPTALAQAMMIGQEGGYGPAYNPSQSLAQNLAEAEKSMKGIPASTRDMDKALAQGSIGMTSISQAAQSFGASMQSSFLNAVGQASVKVPTAAAEVSKLDASLKGGALTAGSASPISALVSQMHSLQFSAQEVQGVFKTLFSSQGMSTAQAGAAMEQVSKATAAVYAAKAAVPLVQAATGAQLAAMAKDAALVRETAASAPAPAPAGGPLLPATGRRGEVIYQSHVEKPAAPPAPHGGTVQYLSHVQKPVAPPAPAGGTVIYHAVVVGGGGGPFVPHAQHGMVVPGRGTGDIVPAMLEPGELVVPKHLVPSVQPILTGKIPGFQAGGLAGVSVPYFPVLGVAFRSAMQDIIGEMMGALASALGSGGAGGGTAAGLWKPPGDQVVQGVERTLPMAVAAGHKLAKTVTDAVATAPETAREAARLKKQLDNEITEARNVASSAVTGLNLTGMQVATPTTTAQGQPYQYYADQAAIAGGGTVSTQQQMGDYLQAMKSFSADIKSLGKEGLNKSVLGQIINAGPITGDALAQSILSGPGGVGAVNALWKQIGQMAQQLGITAAGALYGQLPPALQHELTKAAGKAGKTAASGGTSGTAASGLTGGTAAIDVTASGIAGIQSKINAIHGKTVTIDVKLDFSGGGGGAGGGAGGAGGGVIELTPAQITRLTSLIQTRMLEQAKRNRRTGLALPGYGS